MNEVSGITDARRASGTIEALEKSETGGTSGTSGTSVKSGRIGESSPDCRRRTAQRRRPACLPRVPRLATRLTLTATVVLGGFFAIGASGCSERSAHDPFALMEGQGIYKAECAACHGAKLEGQADWQTRRPDGKLPAPPHDASGHTWHHPRETLVAIVKFGMVPPHAPPGYASDMPAYAGKLTDAQIDNVLAWIESQWPPEIAQRRAQMQPR